MLRHRHALGNRLAASTSRPVPLGLAGAMRRQPPRLARLDHSKPAPNVQLSEPLNSGRASPTAAQTAPEAHETLAKLLIAASGFGVLWTVHSSPFQDCVENRAGLAPLHASEKIVGACN